MISYRQLVEATNQFFDRHWVDELAGSRPTWMQWQPFLFGSVPNHQYAGCYAVFFGSELRYIGLGASRGGGIYVEHGISRRLRDHVTKSDRSRGKEWDKLREKFFGATSIYTLGLPTAPYLAASLETYLIRSLFPPMNGRV